MNFAIEGVRQAWSRGFDEVRYLTSPLSSAHLGTQVIGQRVGLEGGERFAQLNKTRLDDGLGGRGGPDIA